jgi:hypothetical protein
MVPLLWALPAVGDGPHPADAAAVLPTDGDVVLQGREVLEVVVRAPYRDARSGEGRSATVRLVDTIDRAVRAKTVLYAREAKETRDLIEAKGDPIAILKAVRTDVDLGRLTREGLTIEAHNRARRAAGERPARLLAVVTLLPQADKTRVSVLVVDADEGLGILLADEGRTRTEELEQRFQQAVIATPPSVTVAGDDEIVAHLGRLFSRELEPMLAAAGVWESLGTIELVTSVSDAEIMLDGQLVGTTRAGVTRLRDAPVGAHTLGLNAKGYDPYEASVQVASGATVRVDAALTANDGLTSFGRNFTFWSGVATVAAGSAVMVWGGMLAGDQSSGYSCVSGCDGVGWSWVRSGRSVSADATTDDLDVTGSGPALVPLGYSMVLAGSVWALGPQLFEQEGVPWLSLAVGLAGGLAAYGISELVESPITPSF